MLSLDGMLGLGRVTPPPSTKFAGTHLYTWVERVTVRIKCLSQKHNTVSPVLAQTWSGQSEVQGASHEAAAPPTICFDLRLSTTSQFSQIVEREEITLRELSANEERAVP